MKNKRGLEISFAWLFAIIVGAFILFLAIYGTTRIIRTEQTTLDAKTGKQIGILLNPLETGFETIKTTYFTMPVDTRIYNGCNDRRTFGEQIIRISQKSFNKWTDTDIDITFENKYIFSGNYTEGKKFYLFSKPFDFPFKVANLIYLIPANKRYCFIDLDDEVEEMIIDLGQENLILEEDCQDGDVKVCFSGRGSCDISVGNDYVEKRGERVYFKGDALMYAAIFSDKKVYECQLKRLMMRVEQLSSLYIDKSNFISQKGCSTDLNSDLLDLSNSAKDLKKSEEIIPIYVEDIKLRNDGRGVCKLW